MKREITTVLSVLLGLICIGCQPAPPTAGTKAAAEKTEPSTAATRDPQQLASDARDALFKRLSTRLLEAMSNGGPAAAIKVCSSEAPTIAKAVGQQHGVAIGRTSFKLRNPKNAPPEWAQPLVEQRTEKAEFVTLPDGGTGALLPIKLKVQCLTCHGPSEQIASDVKTKLDELYPDDQAIGFNEGDLRGWFWVIVPGKPAAAVEVEKSAEQLFASFDEAYIPALALTKQNKDGPANAALKQLTRRWREVGPQLKQALGKDSQWPDDLNEVEQAITTSVQQAEKDQLTDAHETLEVIRDLMMAARRRQDVSYALDSLSDFHTTMEEIVKPATRLTPETVSDDFLKQLMALSKVADEKWKVAETTQFDLQLFDIQASSAALQDFIKGERAAISQLQKALSDGEKQTILQAARGLKPPFAKAYMFFGDFPKPKNANKS